MTEQQIAGLGPAQLSTSIPNIGCPAGPSLTCVRGSAPSIRDTITSRRPSTAADIVGGSVTAKRNGPPWATGVVTTLGESANNVATMNADK